MIGLLDKHSLIAILIAVLLEELGLPMPIPTDLLIVFAGVKVAGAAGAFVRWFLLLNVAVVVNQRHREHDGLGIVTCEVRVVWARERPPGALDVVGRRAGFDAEDGVRIL